MADEENKAGPIRMAAIENMVSDIRYKGQIMARTNKLESGIMDGGIAGLLVGLLISLILVVPTILFIGVI